MARVNFRRTAVGPGRAVGARPGAGGSGGTHIPYHFAGLALPPPGSFDPGLEAQIRASQRGLVDAIEAAHREAKRSRQDVGQRRREIARDLFRGASDLGHEEEFAQEDARTAQGRLSTSFARDIETLAIAKQRGEEDYQRTLVDMQHRYATTAAVQAEQQLQAGTSESGTTAASGAVRSANQAFDRGSVDVLHSRSLADLARREAIARQDYETQSAQIQNALGRQLGQLGESRQRLGQNTTTAQHALSLAALRAAQDRVTKLSHAKREQGIYQQNVTEQAYYQAHKENPHILFPVPSAAGATHQPHTQLPGNRYFTPHVANAVPVVPRTGGTSYPRRVRRPY